VEADLQFHLAILNASHNTFMLPFGALIQAALRTSFRLTSGDPVAYRRTLTLHRAVLEASVGSRATDSEKAMHRILRQTTLDIASHAKLRRLKSALAPYKNVQTKGGRTIESITARKTGRG
jgi:GntR family galactonate operon transcriptional repressor